MIYEFSPKQDLHGYDKPWAPGANTNILNYADMILGAPSNITYDSATKRTWTEDTYIKGITATNYYAPVNITKCVKTADALTFSSTSTSYAVALVMPELIPEDTYTFSCETASSILVLSVLFYAEDGSFISATTTVIGETATFTVPETAKYTLVACRAATANVEITINNIMLESGSVKSAYVPYANVCPPEGYNIWDPGEDKMIQVYSGYVDAEARKLYLHPVYKEYDGEELVGPWMSSLDKYTEEGTPSTGAFVVDFGGEVREYDITDFMLQTLLDSLGIRRFITSGAMLLNSLMDQAQGRVRSEAELLNRSLPIHVIAIGKELPTNLVIKKPVSDVLPVLPGNIKI